ncbi:MAG: hypothetical protein IJG50_02120 [Clostridia bacterium]|nr:hypothetical protein [Clostridia bacterium]
MYSTLGEKLDFLMRLTSTSNSSLARALNFDPSYISRIRSGKRGLPKNQPFAQPAAVFFTKAITERYQKKTLYEALGRREFADADKEETQTLIAEWLSGSQDNKNSHVGKFLASFGDLDLTVPKLSRIRVSEAEKASNAEFFYGNAGKRKAVEKFLTTLCASGEPHTLLLYSDEDMNWLYESPAFVKRWAALLAQLLSAGSKIKIIHTISRNIGEMLESIEKWVPIYFSGAIEPYYCPKVRDGIHSRSRFIAEGHSALISSNTGNAAGALNILINDSEAVSALEGEFNAFLSICLPLMRVYTEKNTKALTSSISAFHKQEGDIILAHSDPSFFTLPDSALKRLAGLPGGSSLSRIYRRSRSFYTSNIKNGRFVTDILRLPPVERIKAGAIALPLSRVITGETVYLTCEEYLEHLDYMIYLFGEYKNYKVMISDEISENINICVKPAFGVFLYHSASPFAVFELSEPNLTASFEEYLVRSGGDALSRENTQRKLIRHKKAVMKLLKR